MEAVASILFMFVCLFLPSILGSLSERGEIPVPAALKKEKRTKKISHKIKKINQSNALFDDCVQCLVSLGLNKKESKERAKTLFDNKRYFSVEDFLIDVYKIR